MERIVERRRAPSSHCDETEHQRRRYPFLTNESPEERTGRTTCEVAKSPRRWNPGRDNRRYAGLFDER